MNQLNQAIKDKISEHLPALMADELKTFIEKAQRTEQELERTKEILKAVERVRDESQEKLAQHRDLDAKQREFDARERDLASREVQLRHDTAMNRALVAEGKFEVLQNMMNTVFRNTSVNRTVTENVPVAVEHTPPNQFGNSGSPAHVQRHEKSSITTEEKS